jgi:hypothetical protein
MRLEIKSRSALVPGLGWLKIAALGIRKHISVLAFWIHKVAEKAKVLFRHDRPRSRHSSAGRAADL